MTAWLLSVGSHAAMQLLVVLATEFLWGGLHMLIHETGHMLAALMVGSRIKEVGMSKFGPFVRRTSARTPLRNVIVAMAGPAINILTWPVFLAFKLPHAWIPLAIGLIILLPLAHSDLTNGLSYLRREKPAA